MEMGKHKYQSIYAQIVILELYLEFCSALVPKEKSA